MKRRTIQIIAIAIGVALVIAAIAGLSASWPLPGVFIVLGFAVLFVVVALESHRIGGVSAAPDGTLELSFVQDLPTPPATSEFEKVAQTYAFVHNALGTEPDVRDVKVRLQDELVDLARTHSFATPVGPERIDQILASGSQAERVLVFGVLQGNLRLATRARLEEGILRSATANEQFHALRATEAAWDHLGPEDRAALTKAIEDAPHWRDDPDRVAVVERVLGSGFGAAATEG